MLAVESTLKSDEEQAELLLDSVLAQRRSLKPAHVDSAGLTSFRLGIAGPPGAGKSTFIETLGQFLTAQGHKVAVLAIGRRSTAWHQGACLVNCRCFVVRSVVISVGRLHLGR